MRQEDIPLLLTEPVRQFMHEHRCEDPAQLALTWRGKTPFPVQPAAEQIACYQKARDKLADFAAKGALFEPAALEQASGQAAARYKALRISGKRLGDCTAGLGADAFYLARSFESVTCCERNPLLVDLLNRNKQTLQVGNVTTFQGDCTELLESVPDDYFDWLYLDPLRRKEGRRTISLAQSEPDVVSLRELLLQKASRILIKASPALEPLEAARMLPEVKQIMEVSVEGECKEMLLFLERGFAGQPGRGAALVDRYGNPAFELFEKGQALASVPCASSICRYWYEPDPAILRMRLESSLARQMGLLRVNQSTGYLTADLRLHAFPGRMFEVCHTGVWKRKEAAAWARRRGIDKALIARRDFPLAPDAIRSMLGIADGGDEYLFFTRNARRQKVFIHCRAIRSSDDPQVRNPDR